MLNKSISLFLPCYNEEGNLEATVRNCVQTLSRVTNDYEVIIVNDGSTDDSLALASKLANETACIKIIDHGTNLGYGSALRSGIKVASKQLIVFIDCDGQFDITEIHKLIQLIQFSDIAIGYRAARADPLYRRVNSCLFNNLVSILFNLGVRDINCAFKVFRREVFDIVKLVSNGAFINAEILIRAKAAGFIISEAPVSHLPRLIGVQTGARLRVIMQAFTNLFRLYSELRKLRSCYPPGSVRK